MQLLDYCDGVFFESFELLQMMMLMDCYGASGFYHHFYLLYLLIVEILAVWTTHYFLSFPNFESIVVMEYISFCVWCCSFFFSFFFFTMRFSFIMKAFTSFSGSHYFTSNWTRINEGDLELFFSGTELLFASIGTIKNWPVFK